MGRSHPCPSAEGQGVRGGLCGPCCCHPAWPLPSQCSSPLTSVFRHVMPVGIVAAGRTCPYFLLSCCHRVTFLLQTQHSPQRTLMWPSKTIQRARQVWFSPLCRLSKWGVKLFDESWDCVPGLRNVAGALFTRAPQISQQSEPRKKKYFVALLAYCNVLPSTFFFLI